MGTLIRLALATVVSVFLNSTSTFAQQKIPLIGGTAISPGSKPWMASLLYKGASRSDIFNGHFCGATFIEASTVLTAAHCVTNDFGETAPANLIQVYIGDAPRSSSIGAMRNVAAIIVHPDYDPLLVKSDYALLKLDQPVSLSPLPLLRDSESALATPGTSATALGWGLMDPSASIFPDKLQQVTLPLVDTNICEDNMGLLFNAQSMICAGALPSLSGTLRDGTCFGDSGGPLLVSDGMSGWKQAGVVSWGFGCGTPRHYDVFSKITAASDWIYSSPAVPPKNITPPSVKVVNSTTLLCSRGTWDSNNLNFTYRWYRSTGLSAGPVIGGDGESLTIGVEDQKDYFACLVKASNATSATKVLSEFSSTRFFSDPTPTPTPYATETPEWDNDPNGEDEPQISVVKSSCRKATCRALVSSPNLSNILGVQAEVKFVGKLSCTAAGKTCKKKRITQLSNIYGTFSDAEQLFRLTYKVKGTGKVVFKITAQDLNSNWTTVPVITTMKVVNP